MGFWYIKEKNPDSGYMQMFEDSYSVVSILAVEMIALIKYCLISLTFVTDSNVEA